MVKTELTDREKAIAAASLFEGEGCISLSKRRSDVYTTLRLGMGDEDVVRRFASWVGGKEPYRSDPPSHRDKGWKPQWIWETSALDTVTRICGMIYPFLGKRRQEKIVDCLAADTRLG